MNIESGEGERGRRRDRIRVQLARLHQLQELAPGGGDFGLQRRTLASSEALLIRIRPRVVRYLGGRGS
ncbi:hypothetical protein ACFWDI_26330 [Streptomyces sp. NPDC060064]|uniref:hypothetical protein n=1 Tax=Streptomyces sp. NPDC060064 TaxID=3347049 RepID=UPI0036976AC4